MDDSTMIIQHLQNQLYLQDICLERFIHRDKMLEKQYRIISWVLIRLNSLVHFKENKVVSLDVGMMGINKIQYLLYLISREDYKYRILKHNGSEFGRQDST